ncbi:hypothetical protein ACFTT0_06580 [Streptomyces bauhiniae]|uniref:hypothetical protein n=1 Tax=Streptomyces bauhiniae TaxID=2340725 RepID=UPI003629C9E2
MTPDAARSFYSDTAAPAGQYFANGLDATPLEKAAQGGREPRLRLRSPGPDAQPPEGRIGTLAVGAHADLLVIDGNPLEDISVLTRPQECLKHVIKAATPV